MNVNPDPRCNPCHDGCGCVQDEMARMEAEIDRLKAERDALRRIASELLSVLEEDGEWPGIVQLTRETLEAARKAGEERTAGACGSYPQSDDPPTDPVKWMSEVGRRQEPD